MTEEKTLEELDAEIDAANAAAAEDEAAAQGKKTKKQGKKAAKQEEQEEPQEEEYEDEEAGESDAAGREGDSEADPDAGAGDEEDEELDAQSGASKEDLLKALKQERKKRQELEKKSAQPSYPAYGQPQNGMIYPQGPMMMPGYVMPQQPPAPPKEPDFNADPDAWYKWQHEQQKSQIGAVEQRTRSIMEAIQYQNATEEMEAFEEDVAEAIPDFSQAKSHFLKMETARLKAGGKPPHIAKREAKKAYVVIAGNFLLNGHHPAQAFYNYVQAAYNYSPEAARPKIKPSLNRQRELKTRANTVVNKGADGGRSRAYSFADLADPAVQAKLGKEKVDKIINDYYAGKT